MEDYYVIAMDHGGQVWGIHNPMTWDDAINRAANAMSYGARLTQIIDAKTVHSWAEEALAQGGFW